MDNTIHKWYTLLMYNNVIRYYNNKTETIHFLLKFSYGCLTIVRKITLGTELKQPGMSSSKNGFWRCTSKSSTLSKSTTFKNCFLSRHKKVYNYSESYGVILREIKGIRIIIFSSGISFTISIMKIDVKALSHLARLALRISSLYTKIFDTVAKSPVWNVFATNIA